MSVTLYGLAPVLVRGCVPRCWSPLCVDGARGGASWQVSQCSGEQRARRRQKGSSHFLHDVTLVAVRASAFGSCVVHAADATSHCSVLPSLLFHEGAFLLSGLMSRKCVTSYSWRQSQVCAQRLVTTGARCISAVQSRPLCPTGHYSVGAGTRVPILRHYIPRQIGIDAK